MDAAIELARASAEVTSSEIVYLRRRLIIGESTLDNVCLPRQGYDAETKEINFESDKRKAELLILSSLGLISGAMTSTYSIDYTTLSGWLAWFEEITEYIVVTDKGGLINLVLGLKAYL